jgi:hypothetical protein
MFAMFGVVWSFIPYAAAWTTGGWHITGDDAGFINGHLSFTHVLIGPAQRHLQGGINRDTMRSWR